jgi:glycosyltransferase involved in cell wall biosynthesis
MPVFAGAARVMAPNDFVRRIYAGMGFPTGHVVINPLGLDAPPDLPARLAAWRASRSSGGLRLGYVGSISRQKGVHVLIEAMDTAPIDVTLDVYGDMDVFPDYAAELRALARHPGIRFNGLLARGALWETLAGLDALIMPTLWYEGSPAIIREAFAAGLPIIGSDLGATGSMVRHGVDGLLFAAGDAAALGRALGELVGQPERLARLRAGIGPVRVVADHVAQIDEVYAAALGGR